MEYLTNSRFDKAKPVDSSSEFEKFHSPYEIA